MASKFQLKRTTVSTRTPNTTNSANGAFIDVGELAINVTDSKLFSSNGTVQFEVGANLSNMQVTGTATLNNISFSDGSTQTTAPVDPIVYAIALG